MKTPAFKYQIIVAIFLLFACISPVLAHTAPVDIPALSGTEAAWLYLKLGFTHILPLGYDHVLFVLGLYFLSPKLKTVLWQATAFTIAHSITLGLAMYHIIEPPAYLIEPIIALSIAFVALENLVTDQLKWWRTAIVFGFGLIHGCGFAGVLSELGMPSNHFFTALLTFNIGVELGQFTVVAIAYLLVGRWFSNKDWYRKRIVYPVSLLIAFTAFYWTIERIFFS
jgi:hypothetical protein